VMAKASASPIPAGHRRLMLAPHFAPKAKRVIYLHMVGGPSQMDLCDYKPQMDQTGTTRTCPPVDPQRPAAHRR
jgi:hypothetical protein